MVRQSHREHMTLSATAPTGGEPAVSLTMNETVRAEQSRAADRMQSVWTRCETFDTILTPHLLWLSISLFKM